MRSFVSWLEMINQSQDETVVDQRSLQSSSQQSVSAAFLSLRMFFCLVDFVCHLPEPEGPGPAAQLTEEHSEAFWESSLPPASWPPVLRHGDDGDLVLSGPLRPEDVWTETSVLILFIVEHIKLMNVSSGTAVGLHVVTFLRPLPPAVRVWWINTL